ncbi:hypothetical protein CIPAW_02G079200 [Carya illinoinensis]|uniref:Uncharacterized protein n=1 Tax=Carya illinoinensis TaxID=32201 RepID=A0A8T1RCI0_CARIL|nr:hypothetical protein CIPAW_02G079200 [Carya illinoinensis]
MFAGNKAEIYYKKNCSKYLEQSICGLGLPSIGWRFQRCFTNVVEKIEEFIGQFMVACSFKSVEDNFLWAFAGIYGPNLDSTRRLLWEELAGVHSWWDLPWCIDGDFNVTRFPSERSRENSLRPAMLEFSKCIFYLSLVDIPLMGGTFTWSNNQ